MCCRPGKTTGKQTNSICIGDGSSRSQLSKIYKSEYNEDAAPDLYDWLGPIQNRLPDAHVSHKDIGWHCPGAWQDASEACCPDWNSYIQPVVIQADVSASKIDPAPVTTGARLGQFPDMQPIPQRTPAFTIHDDENEEDESDFNPLLKHYRGSSSSYIEADGP